MPRITINYYDDRQTAAAALVALRDVGLNAGDVGSAWLVPDTEEDADLEVVKLADRSRTSVDGIGLVEFTGWMAEAARDVLTPGETSNVATILRDYEVDETEIRRITQALADGMGLVGVRARDSLG